MPFTELITPSLKQDAASRESFLVQSPAWFESITSAPGLLKAYSGLMISENKINVEADFRFVLSIEWEDQKHFDTFLTSDEFEQFNISVKPYITSPPEPNLFETNVGPIPTLSAPITEVFRIKMNDGDDACRQAWDHFVEAVNKTHLSTTALTGTSVNQPYNLFVGILGWQSLEIRDRVLNTPQVIQKRNALEALKDVNSFVAKFSSV